MILQHWLSAQQMKENKQSNNVPNTVAWQWYLARMLAKSGS